MSDMSDYLNENRARLITLLSNIVEADTPHGWKKIGAVSISGFVGFGFSKDKTNLALMVTSSGRSVIDCSIAQKISRDYEAFEGLDELGVFCEGITPIKELILLSNSSSGVPLQTTKGESLSLVSPNWPLNDLIFCGESGNPLIENSQENCVKIASDFIEAYSFSWCGNYFAVANNCDFEIWHRIK